MSIRLRLVLLISEPCDTTSRKPKMASAAAFPSSLFLFPTRPSTPPLPSSSSRPSHSHSRPHLRIRSPPIPNYPAALPASSRMEVAQGGAEEPAMKLLFVEMGVGYDQHGQDITAAAVRACKDAITSNSIPAFRGGTLSPACRAFRRTCRRHGRRC